MSGRLLFKKGYPIQKVRRKLERFLGDPVLVTAEHFNHAQETRSGRLAEDGGHIVLLQDDGHEVFIDTLIAEMKLTDRANTLISMPVRRFEIRPME